MTADYLRLFECILVRTKSEKQEEMLELLREVYLHQSNGTLNRVYLLAKLPQALELLKPEAVPEVVAMIQEFK